MHITVKLLILSLIKNERELIMPLKTGYFYFIEDVKCNDLKLSIVTQNREGILNKRGS